jgi:DNA-binding winged helix-turn-helix (wHTH) protein
VAALWQYQMGLLEFKIGHLKLQPHRQLLDGEHRLPLGSKALALISSLAEAEGRLVTKDELMTAVWGDVIVEENAIQVHVAALRKQMADAAQYLVTVRGVGYRLEADQITPTEAGLAVPQSSAMPSAPAAHAALPPNRISIAVLPLADLTAAQDQAQLIAGLEEGIEAAIARLSSYVTVRHIPKAGLRDLAAIAREIGVSYVLDGNVQTQGKQLRISTRLVAPLAEGQLESAKFRGLAEDGFDLQDRVASTIAAQLESSVMRAEVARIAVLAADDRTAFECFLLARVSAMRVDRMSLEAAQALCERALNLDPQLAVAHSLLGWCHALLYQSGWSDDPAETRRRGLEHSRIAISNDESNHDVLRTYSTAICCLGADLTAADAILSRARAQSPDDYTLMSASAWTMVLTGGKQQQAIDLFEMALALDPTSQLVVFIILGQAIGHFSLRNFEEAARLANEALSRRTGYGLAHAIFAASLAHSGEIDKARIALTEAPPETPYDILLDVTRDANDRALFRAGLKLAGVNV